MKGIVFTEFLEMVEDAHSPDLVEDIVEDADLPSGGAYTAVGTYSHEEMVSLISSLSERTGVPKAVLTKQFGSYLFERFHEHYPQFFASCTNTFDFLENVEDHIHKEVRKLYPEAKLPRFDIESRTDDHFAMVYVSERPFADLCEGLIYGCLEHFGEMADVRREDLQSEPETRVRFEITRDGARP